MDAISGNDAGGETLVPEAELGRFVAEFAAGDVPAGVLAEGRRSLVNVFATAFTGCNEAPVAAMLRAGQPFSSGTGCTVIGRRERADLLLASCINTASANIFDFDDTHEATIIHPAAAVFSALFAHAEQHGASGRDVLAAFVLGCEVECRIGNALTPWHYARGWHITSTCGVFGAAVAAARLLKVAPERMLHVISAAAAQSSGLVETLGTGAKSVSMGGAARNGYMSAVLAAEGCGGPARPLTGERGYLRVYAHEPDISWLTEGLGQDWEFAKNTYKPYPVGVVLNPVIEAVLDLRAAEGLTLDRIESVGLTGHPLLHQRTDRADAATGRQTQVSAQHAIAIVLLTGRAGLEEFSDAAAQRTLDEGRPEVGFIDDPEREVDSAAIEVRLRDGSVLHREIAHAAGSRARPLSDAQLEEKLVSGARYAGYPGDTGKLIGALWNIDSAANAGEVIRLAGA